MDDKVTFTRDDAERLVRIEEHVKCIPEVKQRLDKVERKTNWMIGVGSGAYAVVTAWLGLHK